MKLVRFTGPKGDPLVINPEYVICVRKPSIYEALDMDMPTTTIVSVDNVNNLVVEDFEKVVQLLEVE